MNEQLQQLRKEHPEERRRQRHMVEKQQRERVIFTVVLLLSDERLALGLIRIHDALYCTHTLPRANIYHSE